MPTLHALCFLEVTGSGQACRVSIDRALSNHVGLQRSKRRVQRLIHRKLELFGAVRLSRNELLLRPSVEKSHRLLATLLAIDRLLAEIARSPLGPAAVESALAITARERQRWSRDGRLRQQGSAFLQRGQLVKFTTYSAIQVDELLGDPALIERWRAQDLQFGG